LTRGPQGFTGATVAQQFLPNGTACEVPFPTTITACSDGSLTLSTATYVAVDAECTPAPTQGESPREEHRLVRPGAQRRGQDRCRPPGGSATRRRVRAVPQPRRSRPGLAAARRTFGWRPAREEPSSGERVG